MIDTNCPWTPTEAHKMALAFKDYDPLWLEEPLFPPEDYVAMAELRKSSGVAIAAGENACTAFQFRDMFRAGAVTYAQPSVTKVGQRKCRKLAIGPLSILTGEHVHQARYSSRIFQLP